MIKQTKWRTKKKINKEMKLMLLIRLNGQDLIKSNQDYASEIKQRQRGVWPFWFCD